MIRYRVQITPMLLQQYQRLHSGNDDGGRGGGRKDSSKLNHQIPTILTVNRSTNRTMRTPLHEATGDVSESAANQSAVGSRSSNDAIAPIPSR